MHSVLETFHKAAKSVPAYKKLLSKAGIKAAQIKTLKDFSALPITDKKSYINAHELSDLFADGKFPPMVYASSGSSGKPTFWFRGDLQEQHGGILHEKIFRKIYGIKNNDPTLVVVCFSMGVWVAGNYTLAAIRHMSKEGYHIATITPGLEKEDILNVLKNVAPLFKNVIIAGYPPFLMDIFLEAQRREIPIHERIKIFTAGDSFSEQWRANIAKMLKIKDPIHSIVSIYGCADAGVLGHETPAAIFLRQQALKDKNLYAELFGNEINLPALVQYDPNHVYFEENNGELVFTADTAIPLIRYNIHDVGNVLSFAQVQSLLKKYGLLEPAKKLGLNEWRLPFLVKKGRTDVAVTFYALNIYPENINAIVNDKRISKYLSGNFLVYNKEVDNSKKQKLYLRFELAAGFGSNQKLLARINALAVEILTKLNIEYRKLRSVIGDDALPVVQLVPNGSKDFTEKNGKAILSIKGKKPKMVL